jgi:ubiquinone/menaquinone biosynthesis C-methylase UbiE
MTGLARVLEPELMDTELDAAEYRTIDNREVNRLFVESVLALAPRKGRILDLGTGPGDIAILLAQSAPELDIVAVDLADHMLAIARDAVSAANLGRRVEVARCDAKATGFDDASFDMVVSNSLVHHIPEPGDAMREVARVVRAGGAIFIKDLLRPRDEAELDSLVATYAANDSEYQRTLFRNSLHAALRLDEVERMCRDAGLHGVEVKQVSDRHWTIARGAMRALGKGSHT